MSVLNAFRHQRNKQQGRETRGDKARQLCSTPFGINGTNRDERMAEEAESVVCSTPFGINGTNRFGSL